MKILLLALSILFLMQTAKAQMVFCPPGAEWHYRFFVANNLTSYNEQIKYLRDSILGIDTVKILEHKRFFYDLNYNINSKALTLIRQRGDTIFMRSRLTQNTWQVLYSYATPIGQSWQTTISAVPMGSGTSTFSTTYTITVDSVSYTNVNSFNLKNLFVTYRRYDYNYAAIIAETATITERLAASPFMFNYSNYMWESCSELAHGLLCYEDTIFGLKQFTFKPCDYEGYLDLGENELKIKNDRLKIYPNPSSGMLTIQLEDATISNYNLKLINVLGQEEKLHELVKQNDIVTLNIQQLKKGIYFLQVFDEGKLMHSGKIIKE